MITNYYLRPWKLSDATFIVKLRNNPELKQYFRQEKDLTLEGQRAFMRKASSINYRGYILMGNEKPLGVFALHGSELCIVAPLNYHSVGLNILKAMHPLTMIFGHVFSYNPALKVYLNNGFTVFGVNEKAYKKNGEWVSTVNICSL